MISVWANVAPADVHGMVASWLEGDHDAALATQLKNLDLVHALFSEVNPIPVKAALAEMGLIQEKYRQPLWPMADATRARLVDAMRAAGLVG